MQVAKRIGWIVALTLVILSAWSSARFEAAYTTAVDLPLILGIGVMGYTLAIAWGYVKETKLIGLVFLFLAACYPVFFLESQSIHHPTNGSIQRSTIVSVAQLAIKAVELAALGRFAYKAMALRFESHAVK